MLWDLVALMEEFGVMVFLAHDSETREVFSVMDKFDKLVGYISSDGPKFAKLELREKIENILKDATYERYELVHYVLRRLPDHAEVTLDIGAEQEEGVIRGTLKELLAALTFPEDHLIRIQIIQQVMELSNTEVHESQDENDS
jgi:hypothetical protein